jgi:hypothetical protein
MRFLRAIEKRPAAPAFTFSRLKRRDKFVNLHRRHVQGPCFSCKFFKKMIL